MSKQKNNVVNNEIYEHYGDRWYTAYDDPIALLRAESKVKAPWIIDQIKSHFADTKPIKILDVGCGAGFLSNELAKQGFTVTGVDLSGDSLKVAQKYDQTKSVHYQVADAYQLPFLAESYDVVTAMDFLEHVDQPQKVIQEFSRLLKPNGLFIFHTFNRNPMAYLVIIKFVEWFVKNTPKDMHVLKYFIKPKELVAFCKNADLTVKSMTGIKPVFSSIPMSNFFTGIVPKELRFELTRSTGLSYMGLAIKKNS
jgi:2-polyprenyl-6-hydroxyphenyl methylase/3-demethylubiquinone-9 3-methyltransferase